MTQLQNNSFVQHWDVPEIPLVSVVMPAYNSERFIAESIRSVQDQRFKSWELIVVDDNSTDHTCLIVQGFIKEDPRIQLIPLSSNQGAAISRNTAIEAARGRYIAFLDSDDIWLPWKLNHQLQFIQQKKCALVFGSYFKMDESGSVLSGAVKVPKSVDYRRMLRYNYIGCLTAMYDSSMLGKVLMPNIRRRQDYGLWLQILKRVSLAYGTLRPVAIYRQRAKGSLSSSKFENVAFNWRLYREVEGLGMGASFLSLFFCCLKKLFDSH